jgi:hypothetical protein
MEAKAYGREQREYRFTGRSEASPEVVYDLLADVSSHLEWAGHRQYKMFRLLTIDAPPGPAEVGTVFDSVGVIPMNSAQWQNHNTVTKADRPSVFEITTESRIPWPKRASGEGTFVNRFDIAQDGGGSRVTFTSRQLRFRNPPWGLRYPLLRSVTARVAIPFWHRHGFRKLLRMAEERSRQPAAA